MLVECSFRKCSLTFQVCLFLENMDLCVYVQLIHFTYVDRQNITSVYSLGILHHYNDNQCIYILYEYDTL